MSRSWTHRHTELSPNAASVLTALTVLDEADVVPADLAVALDTGVDEIDAAAVELRQAGWTAARPAGGGDVLVDGARIWLRFDAPEQPKPDEAATIAGRILAAVTSALDVTHREPDEVARWVTEHKNMVLSAVRAGVRHELYRAAANVAVAAWPVAEQLPDPGWWRELAQQGEEAAIEARAPITLIDLLNHSAEVFERAGDRPTAEKQRVRVVQLAYETGGHDRIVASLKASIGLYDRWNRRGPMTDALLELADAERNAGDAVGRAEALAQLGSIMLSAGRPSNAESYFETAEGLFSHAAPGSVRPTMHAHVLEQWGRALWQLGHTIRARRCFTRALELLADDDLAATERVRGLLETHADAPALPDENP